MKQNFRMKLLEACFCFFVAVVEANHRGGSTVRSNKITQANMDALPTLHCCEAQNCELCDISNGHNADIFDCFGQYHYASMRVRYTLGGDFVYFGSCFNAIE